MKATTVLLILFPVVLSAAVLAIGTFAFTQMFSLTVRLGGELKSKNHTIYKYQTVSECPDWKNTDLSKYALTDETPHILEEVVFPSRKKLNFEQGDIHAWYLRHPTEDRPSIIVIHGFRISKKHPNIILTINLLFSAGYDVLAIDMRSHGSSFKTQTLTATFGHGEHLDVLGAVDFLYSRNVTRVGAYGESMGGATLLTALSQDTRIQAGYANSPVCDLEALVRLHFSLYGKWLSPVIFYSAKIASRVLGLGMFPPFDFNPKECASQIGSGRAVFFDHAYGDVIVPVSHSELCSKIAEESGATVERFYFDTHAATPPSTLSMCHDHCLQGIVDAVGYKKRLTDFFNKYLN